jgi:hypothetical protein
VITLWATVYIDLNGDNDFEDDGEWYGVKPSKLHQF